MTYSFLCFELLWAFEGVAHNLNAQVHYYGIAVGHWFIGFVSATPRKDDYGV